MQEIKIPPKQLSDGFEEFNDLTTEQLEIVRYTLECQMIRLQEQLQAITARLKY